LKRLVVISDLHVGSKFGIMPASFELSDGTTVTPNATQKDLFNLYRIAVSKWGRPDVLVVNGDAIDGVKSPTEQWSGNVMDQVLAARDLIEMWGARRIYLVSGTAFHSSSINLKYEEILANLVGSDRLYDQLSLDIEGHLLHFAHHISVSSTIYRTTAIARELALLLYNLKSLEDYEWTIRSHAHYFVHVEYKTHHGVVTPCWQAQTPYMSKITAFGMRPDLGCIRISFDPDDSIFEKIVARPKKPDVVQVV